MSRDDVSLGDLGALVLLLEVGSLTRAAETLGVSQPSLSKVLRRLRAHFGDPLLVRVGLSMRPTPKAAPTLRRQGLYADPFASVVRRGHPRLADLRGTDGLRRERHIVVVASPTGHAAHRRLERAFAAALQPEQVQVRVPSFLACAFLASRTDGVATIPLKLAEFLAEDLGLELFEPPLALEPIGIDQFWHERMHQDRGHRWFRAEVFDLLGA